MTPQKEWEARIMEIQETLCTEVGEAYSKFDDADDYIAEYDTAMDKALQAINKAVAEIVIQPDRKSEWDEDGFCRVCEFAPSDGSMVCICVYNNKFKAEQRAIIGGEK